MKYIAAPLLLLAIIVGYVAAVLGLALLVYVAGPVTAFCALLVLFAGCAEITTEKAR